MRGRVLISCVMVTSLAACSIDDSGDEIAVASAEQREAATAELFAEFGEDTPGCAIGVEHPEGTYLDGFGMADLVGGEPITSETIFDLASVSKQFTGAAVAVLAERGDIELDEPVSTYVDGLGDLVVDVTVADLVHHTSGLPDYGDLLDADDDDVTTNSDVLDVLVANVDDLEFDPGTDFEYSNTNYVLLSVMVEDVTGRPFLDVSEEWVFEPLAMDFTVVRSDQGTLLDGQAQGYADDGLGGWEEVGSSWRQTGDGAVHSTVADVLSWARLFFADVSFARDGVGSRAWRDLMLTGGDVDDDGVPYGFGIGIEGGGATLTHAGSWIGSASMLTVRPDEQIAVTIACNIDDHDLDSVVDEVLAIWQ